MAATNARSEYRLALAAWRPRVWNRHDSDIRPPTEADRDPLAALLLDAYRGTIDDEGEGESEAQQAAEYCLTQCRTRYSLVVVESGSIVAMSFVVVVNELCYIDPVATAAAFKGMGFGRDAVEQSLSLLAADAVREVGAVITDGNVPSERLFASLGFTRVGAWPPGADDL